MSFSPAVYTGLSVLAIIGLILSLIGNFLFWFFWYSVLVGIFKVVLVVLLVLVEFRQSPAVVKPFSFMFYFLGRGIFFIVLGFISFAGTYLDLAGGIIMVVVGIIYVVLHIVQRGSEPENMSFARFQRLTSGITHDLPTSASTGPHYPAAQQAPLAQQAPYAHQNVQSNDYPLNANPSVPSTPVHTFNNVNAGQYNNSAADHSYNHTANTSQYSPDASQYSNNNTFSSVNAGQYNNTQSSGSPISHKPDQAAATTYEKTEI